MSMFDDHDDAPPPRRKPSGAAAAGPAAATSPSGSQPSGSEPASSSATEDGASSEDDEEDIDVQAVEYIFNSRAVVPSAKTRPEAPAPRHPHAAPGAAADSSAARLERRRFMSPKAAVVSSSHQPEASSGRRRGGGGAPTSSRAVSEAVGSGLKAVDFKALQREVQVYGERSPCGAPHRVRRPWRHQTGHIVLPLAVLCPCAAASNSQDNRPSLSVPASPGSGWAELG
jgi:hypothetical protein